MDLVTLMTLKLTARQVGTDRLVTAIMKSVEPVGEATSPVCRYNGLVEASKVPADWHGWLHHTETSPPPEGGL